MKKKNENIKTLSDIKDEHFGKLGTPTRDELDEGYEDFRIGFILQEARIKKGLTQQQLADKVGTSKSYISKIENNVKEARLSTLKKVVELGFGGNVELSINL